MDIRPSFRGRWQATVTGYRYDVIRVYQYIGITVHLYTDACTGAPVHRYDNTQVQGWTGTPVHLYTSTRVHRYTGALVHMYTNTLVYWYTGTPIPRDTNTRVHQDVGTMVHWNTDAIVHYCPFTSICYFPALAFGTCSRDEVEPKLRVLLGVLYAI